ncbi:MAG: hypothetical protein IPK26_02380 [Planctomycetes bacterium]|nr:hypothetical protein [Planctomycetota bacterium]
MRPTPAALPHLIAYVDDPLSHGQVGDGLLSLNEAIQLHNGTLLATSLSIAEQNRVAIGPGSGSDVAWIDIDETVTPTITIERDLDLIIDSPQGLNIRGYAGRPVLDFTTSIGTFGIRSLNNLTRIEELVILGADIGIELTQSVSPFTVGCLVSNVRFEGQRIGAMQLNQGAPNLRGDLRMRGCEFVNTPFGLRIDETGLNGSNNLLFLRCTATNVDRALDVRLGAGGSSQYLLGQLRLAANVEAIRYVRPAGANRSVTFEATSVELRGGGGFRWQGTGPTQATLRFFDVAVNPGGSALSIGPLGSGFGGLLEDSTLDGGVAVAAGGATTALELWNVRARGGPWSLGSTGGQAVRLQEVRFDGVAITTTGSQAIDLQECCVVGGSIAGTASAPIACSASYLQPPAGPAVTVTGSRPAAQLGSFAVLPEVVAIGGPLTLQAALPPGLSGVFALGFSTDTPLLLARPIHVYSDPGDTATIPGVWRLQQAFVFQIPNDPNLVSLDLTAQMVVLPDPGVAAPALTLPPGRRFVVQ